MSHFSLRGTCFTDRIASPNAKVKSNIAEGHISALSQVELYIIRHSFVLFLSAAQLYIYHSPPLPAISGLGFGPDLLPLTHCPFFLAFLSLPLLLQGLRTEDGPLRLLIPLRHLPVAPGTAKSAGRPRFANFIHAAGESGDRKFQFGLLIVIYQRPTIDCRQKCTKNSIQFFA